MSAHWLHQVLAAHATLNLEHVDGRTTMADAILRSLPKDVILAAITESAAAVLRCQRAIPRIPEISREIGNNATQTVLLMLEVDDVGDFLDHAAAELEQTDVEPETIVSDPEVA